MGKFENILIVSDIDGTFLGTGGVIVEKNIEALGYFLSEGGKFTFSTGRVHQSLLNTIPIADKIVSAPGIMSNGGYLYDFVFDEVLNAKTMDETLARKLVEYIYDYNDELCIRCSSPYETFYCRGLPIYHAHSEKSYSGSKLLTRDEWNFKDCCKFVIRGRCEALDELRAALEEKFGDELEIMKSGETFLEVLPFGCSKGSAIGGLREYYRGHGVDVKVYACGDYENDISMLKVADVAVCPSNASDEVKAISDMILCHCSEGLIANLIEIICLSK